MKKVHFTPEIEQMLGNICARPMPAVNLNQGRKTPMTDHGLMTIPEACAALRVSRGFIYALAKREALTLVKLGRASRVRAADVARLAQTGAV